MLSGLKLRFGMSAYRKVYIIQVSSLWSHNGTHQKETLVYETVHNTHTCLSVCTVCNMNCYSLLNTYSINIDIQRDL